MRTICQYPIEIADVQTVHLPIDTRLLSVQFRDTQLTLWALVDESAATLERRIHIFVTGQDVPLDPPMVYLGAVADDYGVFWHVFAEQANVRSK